MTTNVKEPRTATFISWACQCGAYGNVEASRGSAKYRRHRGKMTKTGLQPRPGHGLTQYLFFEQLQTTDETIHEPTAATS